MTRRDLRDALIDSGILVFLIFPATLVLTH